MFYDKAEKITKSDLEQASASWINYLNQTRLDKLFHQLQQQDGNLEQSMTTIDAALKTIKDEIIVKNRGGTKGMHGFIAEVAECGITNARKQVIGERANCVWINDNGPADLIRDGIQIQQKFVASGNHLSLQAIQNHIKAYPWFLREGCKYQIPADHYEKICYLLSLSPDQANKLPTSTGDFSLKQWKEVHDFFKSGEVKLTDIEKSTLPYKSVMPNEIEKTIADEKRALKTTDKEIRQEAVKTFRPSLHEGIKVAVGSAFIEGGYTFCSSIIKRIRNGKSLKDFSSDDWTSILKESGVSFGKGGVRGSSIYLLSNYASTPASVANSLVTATFGVAELTHQFREGHIAPEEFILDAEILCVEVSVSAFSSLIGQAIIPIPVLGAVIGNTVGMLVFQTAKEYLKKKDRLFVEKCLLEITTVQEALDKQYEIQVDSLTEKIFSFYSLLEKAFSVDPDQALDGALEIADYFGISKNDLLVTDNKRDEYFMG